MENLRTITPDDSLKVIFADSIKAAFARTKRKYVENCAKEMMQKSLKARAITFSYGLGLCHQPLKQNKNLRYPINSVNLCDLIIESKKEEVEEKREL